MIIIMIIIIIIIVIIHVYMCVYIYIYVYVYMYIYIYIYNFYGYSAEGGAVDGGAQWIGVVLYSKLVHNVIYITTPCFHCTPLCGM